MFQVEYKNVVYCFFPIFQQINQYISIIFYLANKNVFARL